MFQIKLNVPEGPEYKKPYQQYTISKWSPYIFTLDLKVRFGYAKFMLLQINQGFAKTLRVISFKNDLYFLHRRG